VSARREVRGNRGGFESSFRGDDPSDQARRRDVERRVIADRAIGGAAPAQHVQDLRAVAAFDDDILDARRLKVGGIHEYI
jgi:hypothetical protein